MKDTFIVIGHRTAASVFGAMDSPCKNIDGNVLEFDAEQWAKEYCDALTKDCRSSNVYYTVEIKAGQ